MSAGDFWTCENIRVAIGASWFAKADHPSLLTGGAAIDTRILKRGEVFFALRGERTDGHRFLQQAHSAGAAVAVVDDINSVGAVPEGLSILRVADARRALGRLASAYRDALGSVRTIAVTGSNGKTTTTRMIDACLRAGGLCGHCSPKSYNNDLGVPLTLLGAPAGIQYLLCEVGANDPGEIEPLSRIIRPDIVVVTSIGSAHLEGFGSLEAIAAEKISLATHIVSGGLVVLNADDLYLQPWLERLGRVVTFGTSTDADLRISDISHSRDGIRFSLNEQSEYSIPILGAHNAWNAAAAITVARRLGVDIDVVRSALADFSPPEMRLSYARVGGMDVINDAYNANPDSMFAALRVLSEIAAPESRRVAVLGDMLELGPHGPQWHEDLGHTIGEESLAEMVILVGALMANACKPLIEAGVEVVTMHDVGDDRESRITSLLSPGDTVLLKGSRSVGLERVYEAIRRCCPSPSKPGEVV